MDGVSSLNIWRMRIFYSTYEFLPPMVAEIGWSHNILIIEKCKDDLERQFYIGVTKKYGWTKNVLTHHIEGKSYEFLELKEEHEEKELETAIMKNITETKEEK